MSQIPPYDDDKSKNSGQPREWTEQIEVAGEDLVKQVRVLVEQGNARMIIIRNAEDRVLVEIPLTFGVLAGGALLLFNVWLATLAALAALVARVKIEVVRVDDPSSAKELRTVISEQAEVAAGAIGTKVKEVAEQVQVKAGEVADVARVRAEEMAAQARSTASDVAADARETVDKLSQQAQRTINSAEHGAENLADRAEDAADDAAAAARRMSDGME